ncbi:MAG: hypothetical protein KIG87_07810, partial [Muribaculaceae bacterium]|nr:hypothetical protein [Muribaculaceae bacterium]
VGVGIAYAASDKKKCDRPCKKADTELVCGDKKPCCKKDTTACPEKKPCCKKDTTVCPEKKPCCGKKPCGKK